MDTTKESGLAAAPAGHSLDPVRQIELSVLLELARSAGGLARNLRQRLNAGAAVEVGLLTARSKGGDGASYVAITSCHRLGLYVHEEPAKLGPAA